MPTQRYKQTFANSCGAVSLMCAALELGTDRLPPVPKWPLWATGINPLVTDLKGEVTIYSVTCGGNGVPPLPASGYSLPSFMFEAALAMGRDASGFVPSSFVGMLLQTYYKDDVQRASKLGMDVRNEMAPDLPKVGERLLRVMRVGEDTFWKPSTGLHYIMIRDDGTVMDPATGEDKKSLAELISSHKTKNVAYVDTGIGLLIT